MKTASATMLRGERDFSGIRVSIRTPCRFCRKEWLAALARMRRAAFEGKLSFGGDKGVLPTVELVVATDGEISFINAMRMGCTGPTNILSFPEEGTSLGTLMLSAPTMERESVLYGQNVAEYARRLLAHGMGHLCGMDHGPGMDVFCTRLEAACEGIFVP